MKLKQHKLNLKWLRNYRLEVDTRNLEVDKRILEVGKRYFRILGFSLPETESQNSERKRSVCGVYSLQLIRTLTHVMCAKKSNSPLW